MGKYKYGKPNAEIDLEDFKKHLRKCSLSLRKKAYLAFLYWSGCRRAEPLFIRREDITVKNDVLFITITVDSSIPFSRLKRGLAGGPIELPLDHYGVGLIQEVWLKTREGCKVFPFSDKTGYRAFKELYPKKTPHWLRHNRITKLRKQRDAKVLTIDDIKSFTGIKSDRHVEHYGMKTQEGIHRVAQVLE